ncbi:MAG TPA: hypothetical protein VMM59_12720 [Thermohalobaculum sp.]|nr:hypothetical protein [Thermohalobaculum sp.]
MSFLRPEAAHALRRWAETAAAAAVAALALWLGVRWSGQGALVGWLALGGAALALFWLRAALIGALARGGADGPGVVVIREGEIGYMGPWRGGFLELDRLVRVEIYRPAPGHDPVWRLIGSDGTTLAVPAAAEGAEHLPEALAALPGFSDLAAYGVLRRAEAGRHLVWQRDIRRLGAS